jgi:hypothetical protein
MVGLRVVLYCPVVSAQALTAAVATGIAFCAGAGAASLYVPRYIAEVSPPALRGWLGSLNQVCRCQLVSVGVDWDGCYGIQVLGVSASVLGRAYVSRAYVYCLIYSSWLIPWQ